GQALLAPGAVLSSSAVIILLVALIVPVALDLCYGAAFESSRLRATPGKLLLGIQVVDLEGKQLSFGQAFKRNLGKKLWAIVIMCGQCLGVLSALLTQSILSSLIFPVLGALAGLILYAVTYLKVAWNESKQGLHDEIAETLAVKVPEVSST